jgi:fatty acid desaturase
MRNYFPETKTQDAKRAEKVPKLNLKSKLSKEKENKIYSYFLITLIIIIGLYFLYLGIGGLCISPWLVGLNY